MKVKLLYYTPLDVAYISAKTCYSSESPITLELSDNSSNEDKEKFIKNVMKSGHLSTVEGINFTFLIEGVSRSLLAQITRHRTGVQFSVQSQRYVEYNEGNYSVVTPPSIQKDKDALKIYDELIKINFDVYRSLIEDFNIPAEDARYVLPNATCTNISTTINLRELIHLMNLRLCTRASLEIRGLMKLMKEEVLKVEPWLSNFLVPTCESLGYCPERNCCGKMPKKKEVIK